jgi:hypothetical protein
MGLVGSPETSVLHLTLRNNIEDGKTQDVCTFMTVPRLILLNVNMFNTKVAQKIVPFMR